MESDKEPGEQPRPGATPNPTDAPESEVDAPAQASRRDFLRNAGKKALYITPIVLSVTAGQAKAGPSAPSNWSET